MKHMSRKWKRVMVWFWPLIKPIVETKWNKKDSFSTGLKSSLTSCVTLQPAFYRNNISRELAIGWIRNVIRLKMLMWKRKRLRLRRIKNIMICCSNYLVRSLRSCLIYHVGVEIHILKIIDVRSQWVLCLWKR